MASDMKSLSDSSSHESTGNPEAGLMVDAYSVGSGDLRNDHRDMMRLGKKQEFKV
jgi:hypothetical protein